MNYYKTPIDTCVALAERLRKLSQSGGGTVALSGGSTPKLMFEIMAKRFTANDFCNLKFFWGDERLVPESSPESNYGEFKRALIDAKIIKNENCFPIIFNGNEAQSLLKIENEICAQVPLQNGFTHFNIVILGVGNDGHTASIFPDNLQSFNSKKIVEIVSQPQTAQRRITLTGSAINAASEVIFLCTGAAKAEIINEIIIKKNKTLPATHVSPQGKLLWYADEAAVQKIKQNEK